MSELFTYYTLDEVIDRTLIVNTLKKLKSEAKIELSIDGDIFKIKDIELEESEIDDLLDLFDSNDVFPYHDIDDEDDDYSDFYRDDDEY